MGLETGITSFGLFLSSKSTNSRLHCRVLGGFAFENFIPQHSRSLSAEDLNFTELLCVLSEAYKPSEPNIEITVFRSSKPRCTNWECVFAL